MMRRSRSGSIHTPVVGKPLEDLGRTVKLLGHVRIDSSSGDVADCGRKFARESFGVRFTFKGLRCSGVPGANGPRVESIADEPRLAVTHDRLVKSARRIQKGNGSAPRNLRVEPFDH
jgi:hypothetical protein